MDKKIYEAVAEKHGISLAELKQQIQVAINAAYVSPTPEALKVSRKNGTPTVDEVMNYIFAQFINSEMEQGHI